MRLGILGGTFDPVHYGHLLLAECCREEGELDRVLFLPAAVPPHKPEDVITPAAARVEMLKLAIAGHPQLEVCTYEVDRGGVNYTFETLAALKLQNPDAQLFFLMGSDSLRDLPSWREPARVCELAMLLVARRPQTPEPDWDALGRLASPEQVAEIRRSQVQMPQIGIKSSDLRARLAAGRSIRFQTPRAVEKYIEAQRLYKLSNVQ